MQNRRLPAGSSGPVAGSWRLAVTKLPCFVGPNVSLCCHLRSLLVLIDRIDPSLSFLVGYFFSLRRSHACAFGAQESIQTGVAARSTKQSELGSSKHMSVRFDRFRIFLCELEMCALDRRRGWFRDLCLIRLFSTLAVVQAWVGRTQEIRVSYIFTGTEMRCLDTSSLFGTKVWRQNVVLSRYYQSMQSKEKIWHHTMYVVNKDYWSTYYISFFNKFLLRLSHVADRTLWKLFFCHKIKK